MYCFPILMGKLDDMQELIGSCTTSPSYVLDIIFCQRYNNVNRMKIVTFFYNNGVSEDFMVEFLREKSFYSFDERRVRDLHRYFSKEGEEGVLIRSRYYAMNLLLGRVTFLNEVVKG
jgi:hypothetical protein